VGTAIKFYEPRDNLLGRNDHRLNLHWAAMQLPVSLVDYFRTRLLPVCCPASRPGMTRPRRKLPARASELGVRWGGGEGI